MDKSDRNFRKKGYLPITALILNICELKNLFLFYIVLNIIFLNIFYNDYNLYCICTVIINAICTKTIQFISPIIEKKNEKPYHHR